MRETFTILMKGWPEETRETMEDSSLRLLKSSMPTQSPISKLTMDSEIGISSLTQTGAMNPWIRLKLWDLTKILDKEI